MITKRANSVFDDLGFSPIERANLKLKAAMMTALIDQLKARTLTQSRAAKLMGVTQHRVSDLMRGKLHLFSLDVLVQMLAARKGGCGAEAPPH